MSNPRDAVDAALTLKLANASLTTLATGGVHNTTVVGAVAPYVVFAKESDTHEYTFDKREWQIVYRIACVTAGRWPKAAAAMDSVVDDLLTDQPLTVTGYTHIKTERDSGLDVPPVPDQGAAFYQVGSRFRIWLDEVM